MPENKTDDLKNFYQEAAAHTEADVQPSRKVSGEGSTPKYGLPDAGVLQNVANEQNEWDKKSRTPEGYDANEKKDNQNPFDKPSETPETKDLYGSGNDPKRSLGTDDPHKDDPSSHANRYSNVTKDDPHGNSGKLDSHKDDSSFYTSRHNAETQVGTGNSVEYSNHALDNVNRYQKEWEEKMKYPVAVVNNKGTALNSNFVNGLISGNIGYGQEVSPSSQKRNNIDINPASRSYSAGGNVLLLTTSTPFSSGPDGGDGPGPWPPDDPDGGGGGDGPWPPDSVMLNIRATGERRQKLADATGRMINAASRTLVQQVAVNGGDAGAGIAKMLAYTEVAMSAAHVVKATTTGIMSVPHRVSIKNQYKNGTLVFDNEGAMRSSLHMSKADYFRGVKDGTIIKTADGKVIKKITNRSEYITHLNKQLKMAGVNITISTNLSGYKLESVAKRYKSRLLKEARRKGIPKEKIAPIIKKLNEAEHMGKSTQLVKTGRFRVSKPFKRSVGKFIRTMAKNGDYAGTGLHTMISYQRAITQSTKMFVSAVRHGYMLGSLAIKSSKKMAMKAALANIKKHGDAAVLSKKLVQHAEKKRIKKKARKTAFKKSKLGKIFDKLGNGWGHFRNWTRDPLFIKRGAKWVGKKVKGKILSSRLASWASNSKLFHNPVTKFFGKFFNKIGNAFAAVRYALYKIKQTILLAAGGLLIMLIVASVFFGMIDSALSSLSFLAVKKSNRDDLVSTLNELYTNDMKYMVDLNPTNGITFDNDKDEDLYADQAQDYKKTKKKFEQSTNLAEILSMTYVRFNYDFKHAEFSPSAEAEYNTGLALPSNYDYDSAKAEEGMSWTVPDQAVGHGKLGDTETFTNMWAQEKGHNTRHVQWDVTSNPCGTGYRLWKSKGAKTNSGVCTLDGYYMVACLKRFGSVGDILLVKLSDGRTLPCYIQDTKNPSDSGINPLWGHDKGRCIIESEQYNPGSASNGKNNAILGNARVVALKNMGSYLKKHKSANDLLKQKDADAEKDTSKSDKKKSSDGNKTSTDSGASKTKKHSSEASNEKKLWNLIKKQGFSDIAAAAILANAYAESSYNPKAEYAGAYGLFQWTGERRSTLTMKKDYDKMSPQVSYFIAELKNDYKSCFDNLKKASSIEDAVHTMVYDYEKPKNKSSEETSRTKKAKEIYQKYATGDDVDSTSVGSDSYDSSEDLLTGMDAVKEYVKELYHGSHQIIVSKDDSGAVTDVTYSTKFFGDLFTCGLSKERVVTDYGMDAASSALDGSLYMQDGVIQVPYLNQANGWYNEDSKTYSEENFTSTIEKGKSMQEAGCGLCSTAMAVSYGTGQKVDPINFKAWYTYGQGSSSDIAEGGAKKYGLKSERTSSIDKAIEYLKKGYPVVAHVGGALSKTGGHYLVLTGYKSDGKITMNDPGAQANTYVVTSKEFTKEFIKANQKGENSYTAVIPNDDVLSSALNDGSTMTEDQQKVLDLAKSRVDKATYKSGAGHSDADLKNKDQMEFDCSGLASWVYYQAGLIKSSKDSDGWASAGTAVKSISEAVPGDILVAGDHHHTAIYIGDNKMIEAPGKGKKVKISDYRPKELTIIRRILKNVSPSGATKSVKVGSKTYTASQLKTALENLGSLGCGAQQCGIWVRRAWSRLSGGGNEKYGGLSTTGGCNGEAHSYGVVLGCQSNKSKEIPIGADIIIAYPDGSAGHIGIYVGNNQYVSWSGSHIMTKAVKNGNNGTKGYYDGWCWHHSGNTQVVFGQ